MKLAYLGLRHIGCGLQLIQVQSPAPSTNCIASSTHLTVLANRPTSFSAHENYIRIKMSAACLFLTWKRHSINSHSDNPHSFYTNGFIFTN